MAKGSSSIANFAANVIKTVTKTVAKNMPNVTKKVVQKAVSDAAKNPGVKIGLNVGKAVNNVIKTIVPVKVTKAPTSYNKGKIQTGVNTNTGSTNNKSTPIVPNGPSSTWNSVYNSYISHGKSEQYAREAANKVQQSMMQATEPYKQTNKPTNSNNKPTYSNNNNNGVNSNSGRTPVESGHTQGYYNVYDSAKRAGASDAEAKRAAKDFEKRNSGGGKNGTNGVNSNNSKPPVESGHTQGYYNVYDSAKRAGASDADAKRAAKDFEKRNSGSSSGTNTNNSNTTPHSQSYNYVYESAKKAGASDAQAKKAAQDFVDRNKKPVTSNGTGLNTNNTTVPNAGHSQGYYNTYNSAKRAGASDREAKKAASAYETQTKNNFVNNVMSDFSQGMGKGNALNSWASTKLSGKNFVYNEKQATSLKDSLQDQKDNTDKTLSSLSDLITTSNPNSSEYHKYKAMYEQLSATNRKTEKLLDQCNNIGAMAKGADNAVKGIVTGISTNNLNVQGTKYGDFMRVYQNAMKAGANSEQALKAAQLATKYKPNSKTLKEMGISTNSVKGNGGVSNTSQKQSDFLKTYNNMLKSGATAAQALSAAQKTTGFKPTNAILNSLGIDTNSKSGTGKTNTTDLSQRKADFVKTYNNMLKSGATPEQALAAAQTSTKYKPNSKTLKEMGISTKATPTTSQKQTDFLKTYNNMIKSGAKPEQAFLDAQTSTGYKPDKKAIESLGLQDVAAKATTAAQNNDVGHSTNSGVNNFTTKDGNISVKVQGSQLNVTTGNQKYRIVSDAEFAAHPEYRNQPVISQTQFDKMVSVMVHEQSIKSDEYLALGTVMVNNLETDARNVKGSNGVWYSANYDIDAYMDSACKRFDKNGGIYTSAQKDANGNYIGGSAAAADALMDVLNGKRVFNGDVLYWRGNGTDNTFGTHWSGSGSWSTSDI